MKESKIPTEPKGPIENVYGINMRVRKSCICGDVGTFRCSKCKTVYYCCEGCQKEDWKYHQYRCHSEKELKEIYDDFVKSGEMIKN